MLLVARFVAFVGAFSLPSEYAVDVVARRAVHGACRLDCQVVDLLKHVALNVFPSVLMIDEYGPCLWDEVLAEDDHRSLNG